MLAIAAINFLGSPFRADRRWEDPGRYSGSAVAALVKETFKDEVIFARINRRNSQTKTNRAVRGAATTLDHDVVFATEIDDVPDNQKIAGKPEFCDERQFLFQLTFYFRALSAV